ncbi:MAG: zinc ABC transporter substrate-binding protein [Actinobacteria bacterium]|nr:zinc ABC transporter substrate-binding protein [Actinomycetota bacterium]
MRRLALAAAAAGVALVAASCASKVAPTASPVSGGTVAPPCPVAAIPVVVSVDQWGDIAAQLSGACGEVSTIITGSSADPHEYEPTPADSAKFGEAELVVMNGLGYDGWATKAVDALATKPSVVNAGDVTGKRDGDNPHLWYGPGYVQRVADTITERLKQLLPGAAAYLDQRAAAWNRSMKPYFDEIQSIARLAVDTPYGATETIFDYMASAVGLQNQTPDGYQRAVANRSEPSPGDVNQFQQALQGNKMAVLVFNTQTVGAVSEQLRSAADRARVPIVNVTETIPSGTSSFADWQLAQLRSLRKALSER